LIVFNQVVDGVGGKLGGGIGEEVLAVEADEAALGGEPEEAVVGLEDGVDGVLGKAGVALPGLATVLAESCIRIEGLGDEGDEEQSGEEQEPGWEMCSVGHVPGFLSDGWMVQEGSVACTPLPPILCKLFYRSGLRGDLCFWGLEIGLWRGLAEALVCQVMALCVPVGERADGMVYAPTYDLVLVSDEAPAGWRELSELAGSEWMHNRI